MTPTVRPLPSSAFREGLEPRFSRSQLPVPIGNYCWNTVVFSYEALMYSLVVVTVGASRDVRLGLLKTAWYTSDWRGRFLMAAHFKQDVERVEARKTGSGPS